MKGMWWVLNIKTLPVVVCVYKLSRVILCHRNLGMLSDIWDVTDSYAEKKMSKQNCLTDLMHTDTLIF